MDEIKTDIFNELHANKESTHLIKVGKEKNIPKKDRTIHACISYSKGLSNE